MSDYLLVTVSGRDRVGIVRDVAAAMSHLDINIEDSSMTALRGEFTIMMIVHLPETGSIGALKAALAELEQRTGLTTQSRPLDEARAAQQAAEPNCVITVSGGDRPGIVQGVTEAIADRGGSVVDLSTSTLPAAEGNRYVMALEIACDDVAAMKQALQPVARRLDVDIEVIGMEEELI